MAMMSTKIALLLGLLCIFETCQSATLKFPKDFKFGVATSAYQIEGAWNTSGKGESVWDYKCHNTNDIKDGTTGDIACDSYNKYEEDVQMIKSLGLDFYRFSIAWARILPTGKLDKINQDGIRYYNALIDELIKNNITPMVTLYHWDLPLALDREGAMLNEQFPLYFLDYAELAFKLFGDRIKYWFTFNEPNNCCDHLIRNNPQFDQFYNCTRNLLRAHAKSYRLYDAKYRKEQGGKVGMVIDSYWYEPASDDPKDVAAAQRLMDFKFGIWANPIIHGDYPESMKTYVGKLSSQQGYEKSRLPKLSQEEIAEIKGTHDYFPFNHYSTYMVRHKDAVVAQNTDMDNDAAVYKWQPADWEGLPDQTPWLKKIPWGFRKVLKYIKDSMNDPEIVISENGWSDYGELDDVSRVDYYQKYLQSLLEAIHLDGVNVTGYTAWSLMDNFEWSEGYFSKFGLFSVDFNDPKRPRTPKASAKYYKEVVATREVRDFSGEF